MYRDEHGALDTVYALEMSYLTYILRTIYV